MKLTAHPRLYVSPADLDRLKTPLPAGAPAILTHAARVVAQLADEFRHSPRFDWVLNTHNAHLIRARKMQTRVVTLLTRWRQTGDRRYRNAAVDHIREMGRWQYWSWITWRVNNPRPDAIFDLSYGENSTTLAIAYDWLQATLTPSEKKMFCAIARKWVFASFLKLDKPKHKDWWFKKPDTNWNTVCAGGGGMVALAFAEEFPRESAAALKRAEASIAPFMQALDQTQGGWPEGIGYWGYGMRYAWMYLLSWEHATGKKHPLLKSPNAERTLEFPLDFLPSGEACSFGDINRYWILPFHYAAARRFDRADLIANLDSLKARHIGPAVDPRESWPNSAELLLFHPRGSAPSRGAGRQSAAVKKPFVKTYRGIDWYLLADRWPDPALCLSVRGGTTEVPHGHMDLTSFHCVVGDEALIQTISADEYLDTTFSPRRYELFEMTPPAKNMLLLNGVGVGKPATVESQARTVHGHPAVWIDATNALTSSRDGAPAAKAYHRLFVLFGAHGALILDRLTLPHFGRAEIRMQTGAQLKTAAGKNAATAVIHGQRQTLAIAQAASVPAVQQTARPAMTTPGKFITTLRWCSQSLHEQMTFATLLTPGKTPGKVTLQELKNGLRVSVQMGRFRRSLRLTAALR